MTRYLTAESVCTGHPDKLCDFISDSVLDACLTSDSNAHVACECMAANNDIILAGEISCNGVIDVISVAETALMHIGYNPDGFKFKNLIHSQSLDIANGVGSGDELGAGDQGTVYGYATNETAEFLPLPLVLAHRICKQLDFLRSGGFVDGFLPDGKAQVTVEYHNGAALRVKTVVQGRL